MKSQPNVKTTNASDIASFDPHEMYTTTNSDGSSESHKGTFVVGNLDAAVSRSTTAMPEPLSKK